MKKYTLPFSSDGPNAPSISTDDAGARSVAAYCCALAKVNHSHIEQEDEYAWQMAAFLCGYMAASEERDERKMFIFNEFLQMVEDYLEIAYHPKNSAKDAETVIISTKATPFRTRL